jgi:hypothetical protein
MTPTGATMRRMGNPIPAIMTYKAVRFLMIGHGYITMLTIRYPPTIVTLDIRRESTSILEEYDLLMIG